MARAQFQKGQKVWVECVGAWAHVEKVLPIWAKGFDEPVRVTYDVGLGRDFTAQELAAPEADPAAGVNAPWRLMRARNKWQELTDCAHHPFPGTYPVVVTDRADWGGWRVPGAEYDRDPEQIEFQARLIAEGPRLLALAERLTAAVDDDIDDASPETVAMAREARAILNRVQDTLVVPSSDPKPAAVRSESRESQTV